MITPMGGAPPAGPPVQAPPPAPYGGPATYGGPIEAGCSHTGSQLRGEPGTTFQVSCPASCPATSGLWGSDVYTTDSSICRAALHAGAVPPGGGIVVVRLDAGRPAYRGSVRNGLTSWDFGSYPRSFRVFPAGTGPTAMAPGGPAYQAASAPGSSSMGPAEAQVIEAGCSFSANQIRGSIGSAHVVSCPPGCAARGAGLWGTDMYTGDTSICRAGMHAGLASNDAGGTFMVVLEPGRPAYRGSTRNGIRSSDYGSYRLSFRLQPR